MFKTRKEKTLDKILEKYDHKFGVIERVISSCKTEDQLTKAYSWAVEFSGRISSFEADKLGFDASLVVREYFNLKSVIIWKQTMRKQKELHCYVVGFCPVKPRRNEED